ncbi:DUF4270 domain-containing protein [Winogradskyella ursingii]|uniref:DUF4270 domain-containing protein n=1 Tax=Winogradskyella ursingii TaxID=2686079 RepID=UPI0015C90575|nr:DUF4270 domain-containing protein [Winogradskyella ursingii]
MKLRKYALQITTVSLLLLSFIACDKDFASLESDIINEDNATNFNQLSETYDILTYTDALGPVQTNSLGFSALGYYEDLYGSTTASFVSQLTLEDYEPEFAEMEEIENGLVTIDSVVLYLPYFSNAIEVNEMGNVTYETDSVIGSQPIKLSLFQSNYFLRDFDPDGEFNEPQAYFSDMSVSTMETITEGDLESEPIPVINGEQSSLRPDGNINVNDAGFVLKTVNDAGDLEVSQRLSPGIRLHLDKDFWKTKIIDRQGTADLSSANNFAEYFRGIYFKAESVNDDGSFIVLNTGAVNSNITIYYTRPTNATTDDPSATEQDLFELTFEPMRVNFFENDFTLPLNDGDEENGDSRLFLKGGEGAVAKIKLFDEEGAFEAFRDDFVVTENGKFIRSKRLVNEANLVFYVDQSLVETPKKEPNRIYVYDAQNKTPLVDYFLDGINNNLPSASLTSHLGPLQRVGEDPNGKGIKYKLKITEHINNLLIRDSTNVELGLSVSLNVNLEELLMQRKVQSTDDSDLTVPISSILTPRGTVLHGSNTEDDSKRVQLEIYYTEPN